MFLRVGLFSVLVFPLVGCFLEAQDTTSKAGHLEQAARAFLELLKKGEFAAATKGFDATMQKVLPADKLKQTWDKVRADAGEFKKPLATRVETSDKYQIVHVSCDFAKGKVDARVVFDQEAKITGLFFGAVQKPLPTGVEEIYEGKLKVGVIDLRLVFRLFKQKDGLYAGIMDSPDQGAKDLVLDAVTITGDAVRMELKVAKAAFDGKPSKDRTTIDGTWKQSGKTYPLVLRRVAKASEARRPQTPQRPFPYDEIEVTYANQPAGVKLAGTLTRPKGKGPFPAVLLITGSGPQDRDETLFGHKPFLVLADYLTRRGIAVLRVDDRGVGGSTGNTRDDTTADFAQDVLAGVAFLKARPDINPARIGLIGHSEGGIIAPLVASRAPDVAFIVLLAGTGVPGDEVIFTQVAAMLKALGAGKEQLARHQAVQKRVLAILREEKDDAIAEKKIRAALGELTPKGAESLPVDALPLLEGQVKMALTPWFRHFVAYDPRPALRKVRCPVLALNGARDLQVDAKINLAAIEKAAKEGDNKDVTVQELPGLNHLFQTCKTGAVSEYAAIEETIAPVVLETIADWIAKHTDRRGEPR